MIHDVMKLCRVWILSCKFSFDRMYVDSSAENSEVEKNKVALSKLCVNLPNQQVPAQPSQWLSILCVNLPDQQVPTQPSQWLHNSQAAARDGVSERRKGRREGHAWSSEPHCNLSKRSWEDKCW
jgi:hypothetical protein